MVDVFVEQFCEGFRERCWGVAESDAERVVLVEDIVDPQARDSGQGLGVEQYQCRGEAGRQWDGQPDLGSGLLGLFGGDRPCFGEAAQPPLAVAGGEALHDLAALGPVESGQGVAERSLEQHQVPVNGREDSVGHQQIAQVGHRTPRRETVERVKERGPAERPGPFLEGMNLP